MDGWKKAASANDLAFLAASVKISCRDWEQEC